jgi:E3 Ubiquitin ligase
VHICLAVLIPINKLTMMALFAVGAGTFFLCRGLNLAGRRWSLEHARGSTIREASVGAVAVSGVATGPHTLAAPISGKRCFLYQTTAWQQIQPGRNQSWKKVADETLHLPFFVQDSTGQLLVEPLAAELDLLPDIHQEFGTPSSPFDQDAVPPRISVFLARHNVVLGRPIRIEERTLLPEMPIFIAGTLMENPGIRVRPFSHEADDSTVSHSSFVTNLPVGHPGELAPTPTIIKLAGGEAPSSTPAMTQQQKIAAALTRAGITKPEAWAAADVPYNSVGVEEPPPRIPSDPAQSSDPVSSPAGEQSLRETAKANPDATPPFVLMKGNDGAVFVISGQSQHELVSALGWKPVAMILGGAVLAALGSYVLLLKHRIR